MIFKKKIVTLVLTVSVLCGILGYSYTPAIAQAVDSSSIIRIHVLAHNDTKGEQAAKLMVRDRVLEVIGELVKGARDSVEAAQIIESNLGQVKEAAESELNRQGSQHKVSIQWGRFVFPSRVYGSTALPAGSYQALNVVIGEGKGKNWWCIMYPPLCYVEGVVHKSNEVRYQLAILNVLRHLWQKIMG